MLVILSFVATLGLTISAGLLLFHRDAVMSRLQLILEPVESSPLGRLSRLLRTRPVGVADLTVPFQKMLPRSAKETSVIQKRLTRAGYRDNAAVNIFYGTKVLVPIALAVIGTVTGAFLVSPIFVYGVALGVGFLLPDFWLGHLIKERQRKIRLGLPEALDLMVICTESGLGLDQTMARVAEELKLSQPELREELVLVNLEQKAGRPRHEALKNLADRTDIEMIRALTNTLVQADTFGSSFAKTLRVYSDTLRTQRRQFAEERAAKTTVKLVFPLVFFVFPSIFVVALGPSAISLWEGLDKYFL